MNILSLHLQRMVDEEELQFHEEYVNEQDPSILHFLLASGDDVWY
jgi:beta-ring hydroxylase